MPSVTARSTSKAIPSRGKVLRDPIHSLIALHPGDEFLLDLIGCPEFQRLRRIRQLGVSNITYPGADHTRFSHSIGVLGFAFRILDRLKERYQNSTEIIQLIKENEKTVKAAALLHDIGHGPFSHMLERAFPATAKHEKRTADLLQSLPIKGLNPSIESLFIATTGKAFPSLKPIPSLQILPIMHPILRLGLLLTHLGCVEGRKKFQKLVHILQVMRAPFPERFGLGTYGAYSADLRAELDAFKAEGLIVEETIQAGQYPSFKLAPSEKLKAILPTPTDVTSQKWLTWAEELNQKSAQELEGISTVLFLAQNNWPDSQWESKFKELKPHLGGSFSEYEIKAKKYLQLAS